MALLPRPGAPSSDWADGCISRPVAPAQLVGEGPDGATVVRLEPAGDLFADIRVDEFNSGIDAPDPTCLAAAYAATGFQAVPRTAVEDTFGMTMTKSEASTHASQCSDVGPCETIKIPQAADPPSGSTTLMFQRLALSHTEETVAVALNMRGFQGTYDAVHVPRNRRKLQSLGYAFVNFVHPTHAARAMALCSGAPLLPGEQPCNVEYSSLQGTEFLRHMGDVISKKTAGRPKKRREPQPWWVGGAPR